jgi:hypothetical protein
MDLYSPGFRLTFFPLASMVPEAEADIFLTFKSSMTTKAWFSLIVVEAL